MALKDQPYMPIYVADFVNDEKLMECSAASQGVYIRILFYMHKSEPYGTIILREKDKQNEDVILNFAKKLARPLPFGLDEIEAALRELVDERVLTIDGDMLYQKRMRRDGEISQIRASARAKRGHGEDSTDFVENFVEDFVGTKSLTNDPTKAATNESTKSQQNTVNENEYVYVIESNNLGVDRERGLGEEEDGEKEIVSDSPKAKKRKKWTPQDYSPEFEAFWEAYPRKDDKGTAHKKYLTRRKEGFSSDALLRAAENYAAKCRKNHTGKEYIKQAKTFLSDTRPFEDYLGVEQKPEDAEPDYSNPFSQYTIEGRNQGVAEESHDNPFAQYRR